MKILDVPQTGKLGLTVTFPSRNGLIRRSLVTPRTPTPPPSSRSVRAFTAAARAYDALTDRAAECVDRGRRPVPEPRPPSARAVPSPASNSSSRSTPCSRQLGQDTVDAPPARPDCSPTWPRRTWSSRTPAAPSRSSRPARRAPARTSSCARPPRSTPVSAASRHRHPRHVPGSRTGHRRHHQPLHRPFGAPASARASSSRPRSSERLVRSQGLLHRPVPAAS